MYAQFSWAFCRLSALVFKTNRTQKIDLNFSPVKTNKTNLVLSSQ